jgi:hypothetical protein
MQNRIRFSDLKARGIVNSRQTLENWIRDYGFPPGQLTGPNSRTWGEDDVEACSPAGPPVRGFRATRSCAAGERSTR